MNEYILNESGKTALATILDEVHPRRRPDAYFREAENEADAFEDDRGATIEVSQCHSVDGRPHVIDLDRTWFDKREIAE